MTSWLVRGLCLALVAITVSGCIVVPERGFYRPHPVYYYR